MHKDELKCTYFKTETDDRSIGRGFSEKKIYGGTGLVSEKTKLCTQNLTKAATSTYSATGEFLQYIYPLPVDKNHQKIRSRF